MVGTVVFRSVTSRRALLAARPRRCRRVRRRLRPRRCGRPGGSVGVGWSVIGFGGVDVDAMLPVSRGLAEVWAVGEVEEDRDVNDLHALDHASDGIPSVAATRRILDRSYSSRRGPASGGFRNSLTDPRRLCGDDVVGLRATVSSLPAPSPDAVPDVAHKSTKRLTLSEAV
jgi:hypothetical protein